MSTRREATALAILMWKDWQQYRRQGVTFDMGRFIVDCLSPAEESLEMAREAGVLPEYLGLLSVTPLLGVTVANLDAPKKRRARA